MASERESRELRIRDLNPIDLNGLEMLAAEVREGSGGHGPSHVLLHMADAGHEALLEHYRQSPRSATDGLRLLADARTLDRICRLLCLDRGESPSSYEEEAYGWLRDSEGVRPPMDLSE